MNKKQFLDYVKSFNKQKGTYTDEEVFKIGHAFKSLPEKDKRWKDLHFLLGITDKNSQSLRGWIKRREHEVKEFGQFKKQLNKKYNSKTAVNEKGETLEDVVAEEKIEELNNGCLESRDMGFEELYKERTRVRDTYNAYRNDLRHEARFEALYDAIKESVSKLNKLYNYQDYERYLPENNGTEAILMFSDLHIGSDCETFYNVYNTEIAKRRVNLLVDRTIAYCKENKVSRLNFISMGDAITGIIHNSCRLESNEDVIDQIMVASEIIAQALNRLQCCGCEIIYRSCSDNHSRVMPNKEDNLEQEYFGRLVDWYLKERLKDTKIIFANDNPHFSFGKFKLKNGKNVVFSHGHQGKRNESFQNYVGALREYVNYILLAHFHSEAVKGFENCKVFVNGSIIGTESYALSRRLFSDASQKLLIFRDDDVIDHSINLQKA